MKKSLFAIAVVGAFAGAAQAQSSVTVYGLIDVGLVGSSYRGTSVSANSANVNNTTNVGNAQQNQTSFGIGQSAESTSRLGLRGTEDLGGGTSALFVIETGLSPNQAASAFAFNRQTFAGLAQKGYGRVTFGTQYTPVFEVGAQTDAAGYNNLVGNMLYSGSLQSGTGTYNQGLGPYCGQVANQSLCASGGAFTTRFSNMVKFQSERFSGLAGSLVYGQASNSSTYTGSPFGQGANTANGGANNNTMWGANLDFEWNKLKVVAATQSIRSFDPGSATATASSSSTTATGSAASYGYNMNDSQTYAAATYDFGIFKAYYGYITRKVSSVVDSNQYSTRMANQIGVRGNVSKNVVAYATYGMGKSAYFGSGLAKNNFTGQQLGVDYLLSKRTNLYAAYGAFAQGSNGYTGAGLQTQNGIANGGIATSGSNYAVGVRHTF